MIVYYWNNLKIINFPLSEHQGSCTEITSNEEQYFFRKSNGNIITFKNTVQKYCSFSHCTTFHHFLIVDVHDQVFIKLRSHKKIVWPFWQATLEVFPRVRISIFSGLSIKFLAKAPLTSLANSLKCIALPHWVPTTFKEGIFFNFGKSGFRFLFRRPTFSKSVLINGLSVRPTMTTFL